MSSNSQPLPENPSTEQSPHPYKVPKLRKIDITLSDEELDQLVCIYKWSGVSRPDYLRSLIQAAIADFKTSRS